jgi:hypothetical protein
MPSYVKRGGFRPVLPGSYIVEMSVEKEKWAIFAWKDHELMHMIEKGYQIK